jgi:hypothetical protein
MILHANAKLIDKLCVATAVAVNYSSASSDAAKGNGRARACGTNTRALAGITMLIKIIFHLQSNARRESQASPH